MTGKNCLVTGANTGIGKATALGLARRGASVVMVCRDRKRGEAAQTEIKRKSGNESVALLLADLSSQASIRQLVQDFTTRWSALHVLVNNAGVILRRRTVTDDGLETQFAVNHLAYFLLTNLLLDRLQTSAPARVVNVASAAHLYAAIDFDDLQSERSYRPGPVYAWTKLANLLFTYELARRLQGTRVTANCLHPGLIATNLVCDYVGIPRLLRFTTRMLGASPQKGARTPVYLSASSDVETVTGRYFVKQRAVRSSRASYDETAARRLWEVSAELTGLR